MIAAGAAPLAVLGAFADAFEFIASPQQSPRQPEIEVGGPAQVAELTLKHLEVTLIALAISVAIAVPVGLVLGHYGKGELLAVAVGNAGRAIPELALIAFFVAFVGVGLTNVTIALVILGIPPILTNTFVGVRQVDQGTVAAARGVGMREAQIARRVELPLAVPTIMSGIRTSTINVVATATIAPLAGVLTLGDLIINRNVYGDTGVLAGAIMVALLALTLELTLSAVQRLLTPRGLRLERATA